MFKYLNITWDKKGTPPPEGLFPLCLKFEYQNTNTPNYYDIINWFDGDGTSINNLLDINFGVYNNVPNDDLQNTVYYVYFDNNTSNQVTDFFGNGIKKVEIEIAAFENNPTKFRATYTNDSFAFYGIIQTITDGPSCFSEGTNILGLTEQLKEEYRLVQNLMIGDFVKSYLHGYRKVSKIISGSFVNNPKNEGVANCMYKMVKTDDNGLIEDLTLTRNHGVLVEKLTENEEKKIDKNNLHVIDNLLSIITADCDKFEKVMNSNVYKYYHFSLETDGDEDRRFGVWANGLLVEVPSNNMMDGALNVKPLDF